jgi:hypothetical protein
MLAAIIITMPNFKIFLDKIYLIPYKNIAAAKACLNGKIIVKKFKQRKAFIGFSGKYFHEQL